MQNVAGTCNLKFSHICLQLTFFCPASTADLLWPGKVCSSGQTKIAGNIFEWENQYLIKINSFLNLPFYVVSFFPLKVWTVNTEFTQGYNTDSPEKNNPGEIFTLWDSETNPQRQTQNEIHLKSLLLSCAFCFSFYRQTIYFIGDYKVCGMVVEQLC